MDTLDELLKDSMDLHAADAADPQFPQRVTVRVRRERRIRATGVLVAVVGSVSLGLWGASAMRGETHTPQAAAIVSSGECAGLTIVIGKPNPGEGAYRSPVEATTLTAGSNTITMARKDYRWLEASGPCRSRLILEGPGPVVHSGYVDKAHAATDGTASASGPFRDEGEVSSAMVFTNEPVDGTGEFTIRLDAACESDNCPAPIATVRVVAQGSVTYDSPSVPAGQVPTMAASTP